MRKKKLAPIKYKDQYYWDIDKIEDKEGYIGSLQEDEVKLGTEHDVETKMKEYSKEFILNILRYEGVKVKKIKYISNKQEQYIGVDIIVLTAENKFYCYDVKATVEYVNEVNLPFEIYQHCEKGKIRDEETGEEFENYQDGWGIDEPICENHYIAHIDLWNCYITQKNGHNIAELIMREKEATYICDYDSRNKKRNDKLVLYVGLVKNAELYKSMDIIHYVKYTKYYDKKKKERIYGIAKVNSKYRLDFNDIAKEIEELIEFPLLKNDPKEIIKHEAYRFVAKYGEYIIGDIAGKGIVLKPKLEYAYNIFYNNLLRTDFKYRKEIKELRDK